ncbi:unnamed protein product [Orchesella dallaii]|uniref:BTB domain-containing protein n=1 Tax=Orchesella dallaii TaxID=48710 RepID=A0ABP1RQZ8_9HEXA
MAAKYDRGFNNARSRYFQGSVPICPTAYLGRGKFSLEIIEQEIRDFSRYAHPIPPAARVLVSAEHTDFLLRSAEGYEFPCLKSFLSVCSPVFERMLSTDTPENRDSVANVPASQAAVNSFLKYVYYEDMVDPCRCVNVALELLKLSILYAVEPLANSLKHVLMNKPVGAVNLDTALNLFACTYQHAGMIELKNKALEIIRLRRNQFGASLVLWNCLQGSPELVALQQQL